MSCSQPVFHGPSREFRYYNVAAFHPTTNRLHNTRCWLHEAEVCAAIAGNGPQRAWILLIIANMFRWNPNIIRIDWNRVVITDLPIPPNQHVPHQSGAT